MTETVYLVMFTDFTGQAYPDSIWDNRLDADKRADEILNYSHILSTSLEKMGMNEVDSSLFDHELISGLEAEYEEE